MAVVRCASVGAISACGVSFSMSISPARAGERFFFLCDRFDCSAAIVSPLGREPTRESDFHATWLGLRARGVEIARSRSRVGVVLLSVTR